jgi:hypothetical protein
MGLPEASVLVWSTPQVTLVGALLVTDAGVKTTGTGLLLPVFWLGGEFGEPKFQSRFVTLPLIGVALPVKVMAREASVSLTAGIVLIKI